MTKKKNTSKFANKIAEAYFKEKSYKEEDYTGKKNDKGLIRKKDIVEWEKKSPSGKVNSFTPGAQALVNECEESELLVKVLEKFFGDKMYTSKSRWGKKQVQKSIEYLEIYNKINELN